MESSQFNPPQRTSLNDVELAAAIGESHKDEAGILAAMQLLESQTQLREYDERAKVVWEDQMLRIGTPEALRALDNARRVDDGLEPIPYEAPKPVEPEPFEPEPVEPEPVEPEPVEAERVEAEPVEAEPVLDLPEIDAGTLGVADALNAFYGAPTEPVQEADFDKLLEDSNDLLGSAEEASTAFEETHPKFASDHLATSYLAADDFKPAATTQSLSVWFQGISFATASLSMLPVLLALGLVLNGYSFTQVLLGSGLAILFGSILIATASVSSVRAGMSTSLLSKAAFGVKSNAVPIAVLAIIRLIALGAILFYSSQVLLALFVEPNYQLSSLVQNWQSNTPLPIETPIAFAIALVVFALLVFGVRTTQTAFAGFALVATASILVFALTGGISGSLNVAFDFASDFGATAQVASIVFACIALIWLPASGDVAQSVRAGTKPSAVFFVSLLSTGILPIAVLILGLTSLTAITQTLSESYLHGSIAGLLGLLTHESMPMAILVAISAIGLCAFLLKSVAISTQSIFGQKSDRWTLAVAGVLGLAISSWIALSLGESGFFYNAVDYAVILSIPAVSWFGIFISDSLLRRGQVHALSITRSFGYYQSVSIPSVITWLVSCALGLGFVTSDLVEFEWTGYFLRLLPDAPTGLPAGLGLWIALGLALLAPIAFGIPRIRAQEQEIKEIESRRDELVNIFGLVD